MSTVDDLARWSDAPEAGKVVSPASRDRMFTSGVLRGGDQDGIATRYGLGNAMTEVAGRPTHEHGGGIHGFTCDLLRVPGEELLVVSGRAGKDSFIVAFHRLPGDRYRIASTLWMKGEKGPVVLGFNGYVRRKLAWATCWECSGESGNVTYREDGRVVITQK